MADPWFVLVNMKNDVLEQTRIFTKQVHDSVEHGLFRSPEVPPIPFEDFRKHQRFILAVSKI